MIRQMNHEFYANENSLDGLKKHGANSGITQGQESLSFSDKELYSLIKSLGLDVLALKESVKRLETLSRKAAPEEWITSSEVMKMLQVSKRTLQHFRNAGLLPCSRLGQKYYYRRQDIRDLLKKGMKRG